MKQYELTIVRRNGSFSPVSVDKIEAESLIELSFQLHVLLMQISDRLSQEAIAELRQVIDDDIPF